MVVEDGLVEDLGDRPAGAGVVEQVHRPVDVVGAEDDVHVRRLLADELLVLLGQAAGHHDLQLGAGVLLALQVAEVAVQLVVGVLPDAARVEDDDVGVVRRGSRAQPVGLQQTGEAFGVVLVHLAPEGAQVVRAGLGHAGQVRGRVPSARLGSSADGRPAHSGRSSRPSARRGMNGLCATSHRWPSRSVR